MKITSALLLAACLAIANVEAKSLNMEKAFAAKLKSPKATLIDIPTEAQTKSNELIPVIDEPKPEVFGDATKILEPVIIAPVDINSIVDEQIEAQAEVKARQEADEKA